MNIEANALEESSEQEQESEGDDDNLLCAAYTDVNEPLPPLRKREWKRLHK
jgi:hypothetical protein